MEIVPFVLIILGIGWYASIRYYYKKGYRVATADKEEYAQSKLDAYTSNQQWVYEDSTQPLWRYSKVTGQTQKRYLRRHITLTQSLGWNDETKFTEWANVEPREVVRSGGKRDKSVKKG